MGHNLKNISVHNDSIEHDKISILIPSFNQQEHILLECVNSCISQTYKNIEIIISDNFSSNNSVNEVKKIKDRRIRIVSPKKFLSMNENFAYCASHAQSNFISFLSSDDVLLPTAIERLISSLKQNPEAAFAFGNAFHHHRLPKLHKHKLLIRKSRGEDQIYYDGHTGREFFFPWKMSSTWMVGNLITTAAYIETGGFGACNLEVSGDVWITDKLLAQGGFVYVDEPLALFRARSVGHIEVDPDRRISDFIDYITINANQNSTTFFSRIRENIVLSYRMGINKNTSREIKIKAASKFQDFGRHDLAKISTLSLRLTSMFSIIANFLSLLKICRDFIRQMVNQV